VEKGGGGGGGGGYDDCAGNFETPSQGSKVVL
jgi:hypothetical protein